MENLKLLIYSCGMLGCLKFRRVMITSIITINLINTFEFCNLRINMPTFQIKNANRLCEVTKSFLHFVKSFWIQFTGVGSANNCCDLVRCYKSLIKLIFFNKFSTQMNLNVLSLSLQNSLITTSLSS